MSSKNQVSVNYILKWNELQEFCFTDGVAACCCVTGKPASPDMELVAGSEMDENGSPKTAEPGLSPRVDVMPGRNCQGREANLSSCLILFVLVLHECG